jgi:hypothetical protein
MSTLTAPDRTARNHAASDKALQAATGRGYDDWFALLDAIGAESRRHGEIVAWLMEEHGIGSWWAQRVTVDYEQARGLRPPGGGRDGTFTVTASKTVGVPVERLYAAFADPELRERWLLGRVLRERTSRPGRSVRFDCEDGATRLAVGFNAMGPEKSQVALAHERLADAEAAAESKAYWRERMAALKTLLEG